MISSSLADAVLLVSLMVSLAAYVFVSKREGSYVNILTPTFITTIPAYYLLPLFFTHVFGNDASVFAYIFVYTTLVVENLAYVYAYTRPPGRLIRLPLRYSYSNFDRLSFVFLGLAVLMYLPVVLEFPEYILDPRQIYMHTRTGFGVNFYLSSTLAYLAVILIQFTGRSRWVKGFVILVAGVVLSLHGSKAQMFSLILLLIFFQVYVRGRRVKLLPSLIAGAGLGFFLLLLFAASMALGDSTGEVLEAISQYSDYTRNAMMVVDSHLPRQYGRLSLEAQIYGRIPRVLMPNKPKNFGGLYLDDYFYPESIDADVGAPDFGIGVQYADFGVLSIVYIALSGLLKGWLARVFVSRLRYTCHPADFLFVAFLAEISLIPVGAIGWLLPETLVIVLLLRFTSCFGADTVYRERLTAKGMFVPPIPRSADPTGIA